MGYNKNKLTRFTFPVSKTAITKGVGKKRINLSNFGE